MSRLHFFLKPAGVYILAFFQLLGHCQILRLRPHAAVTPVFLLLLLSFSYPQDHTEPTQITKYLHISRLTDLKNSIFPLNQLPSYNLFSSARRRRGSAHIACPLSSLNTFELVFFFCNVLLSLRISYSVFEVIYLSSFPHHYYLSIFPAKSEIAFLSSSL